MIEYLRRSFLGVMIGAIVGLLGAVPLAGATGFNQERYSSSVTPLEFTCGFLLFLLTLAVMGPVTRGLTGLVATLRQTDARPGPIATLGLLSSGTLCVISSLYFAWASRVVNPAAEMARQMQESLRGIEVPNAPHMNVNVSVPSLSNVAATTGSGAMILTVLVFVLGVGLIAMGVWAVLPPGPRAATYPANGHMEKPAPVPAADAASL